MSEDDIHGALVLAMTDSSKSCVIPINGQLETYLFVNDPVNKRKCKLFKSKYWEVMFRSLYLYVVFGVYITASTFIITPCTVYLKAWDHKPFVLYAILETMCNKPRYDGLCIDREKGEVFIMKSLVTNILRIDLTNVAFDRSEAEG